MTYVIGEYTDSYIPVVDGVATCVRNYAKWLNENHCEAYVVAPEIPGFEEVDPFKVYRFKGIPLTNHKPYRAGPARPGFWISQGGERAASQPGACAFALWLRPGGSQAVQEIWNSARRHISLQVL